MNRIINCVVNGEKYSYDAEMLSDDALAIAEHYKYFFYTREKLSISDCVATEKDKDTIIVESGCLKETYNPKTRAKSIYLSGKRKSSYMDIWIEKGLCENNNNNNNDDPATTENSDRDNNIVAILADHMQKIDNCNKSAIDEFTTTISVGNDDELKNVFKRCGFRNFLGVDTIFLVPVALLEDANKLCAQRAAAAVLAAAAMEAQRNAVVNALHKSIDTLRSEGRRAAKIAQLGVTEGLGVYLYGPAGTGKTTLVKQIAQALELDFVMQSCVFFDHELFGYNDATGNYQSTAFYNAFKNGGVFLLDEIDCSDIAAIKKLNAAIANNFYIFPNGERVERNDKCLIFAAGNTLGKPDSNYTAAQSLDVSTVDRFVPIRLDYNDDIDKLIADKYNNAAAADFVIALRRAINICKCDFVASLRLTQKICVMALAGDTCEDIIDSVITPMLSVADVRNLCNYMQLSDNSYFQAMQLI